VLIRGRHGESLYCVIFLLNKSKQPVDVAEELLIVMVSITMVVVMSLRPSRETERYNELWCPWESKPTMQFSQHKSNNDVVQFREIG